MTNSKSAPTPVWAINTLDFSLPDGTVTTIHWTVNLNDDDGYSASAYGTIGLGAPDPDNFTPYLDLSREQVQEWLKGALGQELVDAYEASLAQQIQEQRNPTHATGLPWNGLNQAVVTEEEENESAE